MLPPEGKPVFCFYPMTKRRGDAANWYATPYDERNEMMREHGVNLEKLYFDVPRLSSAYPSHFLSSGIAYAFHPHRDT